MLAIGAIGGLVVPLVLGAFLALFGIRGDLSNEQCGAKPWIVYVPGLVFTGLAGLISVVSLLRALTLFAYGVGDAYTTGHKGRVLAVMGTCVILAGAGWIHHQRTTRIRLSIPAGIAMDVYGDIYVADGGNSRIAKLSPTGAVLDTWHVDRNNPAQITEPDGVAVDRAGNVFVTYWAQDGVQKLSPSGKLLAQFDTKPPSSSDPSTFWTNGLQIDRASRIWVVTIGGWVEEYTSTGTMLQTWFAFGAYVPENLSPAIAVDRWDRVYLTDPARNRVLVFSPTGQLRAEWGKRGLFHAPTDVAVNQRGEVYVIDADSNRILALSSTGRLLRAWKAGPFGGRTDEQFGIMVDGQGSIYATTQTQIQKFSPSGRLLNQWL